MNKTNAFEDSTKSQGHTTKLATKNVVKSKVSEDTAKPQEQPTKMATKNTATGMPLRLWAFQEAGN